ncbi:MAG: HDIG domain-containing protein [Bacteroidales bacterium]|jgi:putative nucleotidyltransferase with HDIG domain|nr:HDIG domain-containing protein [Bacteroidales bacterium]
MDRNKAEGLLKKYVRKDKMLYHSYAAEAVMRALAESLGRDVEKWGLAGLLHDIDTEITNADPLKHGLVAEDLLLDEGIDADIVDAIKMHNEEATGLERTAEFQHALAAGETITGLIFAVALVYPDKKIKDVKPKSITKRMKQSAFAASVSRENILECEKIGLSLNDFTEIALGAMKEIADKIKF